MKKTAIISTCGVYRYSLTRSWNDALPRLLWVMLNPSTADADNDDPTIRRCISFAKTLGYGSIQVVNLFAYRATQPDVMFKALKDLSIDIVGPDNDKHICEAIRACNTVVFAWGANGHALDRDRHIATLTPRAFCLGTSGHGHPKHPLYIIGSTPLSLCEIGHDVSQRFIIPDDDCKRPLPCSLTGVNGSMVVSVAGM